MQRGCGFDNIRAAQAFAADYIANEKIIYG